MDKDELIKNLLKGVEHTKEQQMQTFIGLADGFMTMQQKFIASGMDVPTANAVSLEIIKAMLISAKKG